ncbi:MAG: hypothetical protein KDD99_16475, partial [Bacteroidetes bacterium]|nr:hypothetical protein [Bacteroidota bacterium]
MKLTSRILLVLLVIMGVNTLMYITWQVHTPWEKIPRSFLAVNPLNYRPVSLNILNPSDQKETVFLEDFFSADSTGEENKDWENNHQAQSNKKTKSSVNPTTARLSQTSAPLSVERCQKILTKLWAKQGGEKMPSIRLANIAQFGKPAEYNSQKQEIIIDPRAYQLCLDVSNQKDDALAFLIAHELVHSYQHGASDYTSPGFFVKSGDLKSWAKEQKEKRKTMESQADVWGAILCYLCGYKVDHIIPD